MKEDTQLKEIKMIILEKLDCHFPGRISPCLRKGTRGYRWRISPCLRSI